MTEKQSKRKGHEHICSLSLPFHFHSDSVETFVSVLWIPILLLTSFQALFSFLLFLSSFLQRSFLWNTDSGERVLTLTSHTLSMNPPLSFTEDI